MQIKRVIFGLAAVFTIVLGLSTCQQTDLFPEYRGVNLISGKSFADWVPDQNTPYMNYEQVSGTGYEPPSDHAGAEVYRLEIKDLIPNGDFEDGTVGGWTLYDYDSSGDKLEIVNTAANHAINNYTMHFALNNSLDRVDYDPMGANPTADNFLQNASYIIRFKYRTGSSIYFEYNDTSTPIVNRKVFGGRNGENINPTVNNIIDFPLSGSEGVFDITVGSSASYNYCFGSRISTDSGPQEGYIDNVRLIRTDLTYKLRLTLSYADDTSQPLISGYYRFSVYVKSDPSTGSNNRFSSDRVCIGITGGGVSSGGTGFDESSFSNYVQYYDGADGQDWSEWSEISVDLALQIPNSSSRAMELSICPTDDSKGALAMDAGSILISSPSLEMFPDGFP